MRQGRKSVYHWLAVVAVGLSIVPSATAVQPGNSTIRITGVIISTKPKRGVTHIVGGTVVFTAHLYNKSIRKRAIGSSVTNCTYLGDKGILGSGNHWCAGIYTLPKGALVAEGLMRTRYFYQLVVSGGTGIYANVTAGQLVVSAIGLKRVSLIFSLQAA